MLFWPVGDVKPFFMQMKHWNIAFPKLWTADLYAINGINFWLSTWWNRKKFFMILNLLHHTDWACMGLFIYIFIFMHSKSHSFWKCLNPKLPIWWNFKRASNLLKTLSTKTLATGILIGTSKYSKPLANEIHDKQNVPVVCFVLRKGSATSLANPSNSNLSLYCFLKTYSRSCVWSLATC